MPIYTFLRSRMLPLRQIDNALPSYGKIIDLGCGQGIIATALSKRKGRQVYGVDLDINRLPQAGANNLKFVKFDIRKYNIKGASGIVISDVLHHLSVKNQKLLLSKIAGGIKKGGVLVIKEIDTSQKIRSRLSRFWDFVFYPKDEIYFSSSGRLKPMLEKLGFDVSLSYECQFFPGSTTLYRCIKK